MLKQEAHQKLEFVLCWPTSPGRGAWPGVGLVYTVTLPWRKLIPLCQQVWMTNGLLIRGGTVFTSPSWDTLIL